MSATHDTFLMFADSEKDMDSWIDAINCILYEVCKGVISKRVKEYLERQLTISYSLFIWSILFLLLVWYIYCMHTFFSHMVEVCLEET